ncbi:MAG: hypothetical protein H6Q75_1088 [Firmicutes bacterium]|nr:hypothetical protein [Bacillota bacterium]
MDNITEAVIHTPWWVFILLGYLILVGISALQTRIIPLYKIFTIPLLFIFWAVYTLLHTTSDNTVIISWATTLLLGGLAGFYHIFRLDIKVDRKNFCIQIPGSWHTLVIMQLIFSSKYYFSYDQAVHPQHAKLLIYMLCMFSIGGLLTGFLQGRLIGYLYHYKETR